MREFCRELAIRLAYFLWLPLVALVVMALFVGYLHLMMDHPVTVILVSILVVAGVAGHNLADDSGWLR